MRLYLDDDSVATGLIRMLRRAGHDVQIPADVGLSGRTDPVHLGHAIRDQRAILTQNYGDFDDLHQLVIVIAGGHHRGILVVRHDNNPKNNMSSADIVRAVRNLEKSGVPIADNYHELNHWQ